MKKKTHRNMIDTSWYIESLVDDKVKEAIEIIGRKTFLKSCEQIQDYEIKGAYQKLRAKGEEKNIKLLRNLFETSNKGIIKIKPKIIDIVNTYSLEAYSSGLLSRKIIEKMKKGDFVIVATASFDNLQRVFTKNRKSMGKSESIEIYKIYNIVNKEFGLKTPKILKERQQLLDYAQAL